MDLKSISGFTCYVKDLDVTAKFYESLGLRPGKREAGHMIFYVNWFWIEFVAISSAEGAFKKEAGAETKGAGLFVNVSVADVDAFYNAVVKLGLKPSSEPTDQSWGRREFVLRDPDGYKLVFFQK